MNTDPTRNTRTLRAMGLVLAIGLVPLGLGAASLQHRSEQRARAAVDGRLADSAGAEAETLEAYFEKARAVTLLAAQNPAFRRFYSTPGDRLAKIRRGGALMNDMNEALGFLEHLYPHSIGEACFIDRSGAENARMVRGVRAALADLSTNEAQNPFFYPTFTLRPGGVYQARPYVSPDTGEWVISNSTPLSNASGPSRAIVHFEVTLQGLLSGAVGRGGVDLDVIDAKTGAIVHSTAYPALVDKRLRTAPAQWLDAIRGGAKLAELEGRRGAFERVQQTAGNANDWYVLARAEPASATFLGAGALLPGGAIFAVLLLLSYFVGCRWVSVNERLAGVTAAHEQLRTAVAARRHAEERRNELEVQLNHSQKLEAIGRLAGGIAHDFNNLLMAITGYSSLLYERLEGDSVSQHEVGEIQRASARAASLTSQLLAFSRKQVLRPQTVDVNTIVCDLQDMVQRLIGPQIDVVTNFHPELAAVEADPGQLEQVIVNLVVNARDAMPDGGRIVITTANTNLTECDAARRELEPGPHVEILVSDNGSGMDERTQARIFEPFFTTKQAGHGTGLGLATAYGIVRQSGGDIAVTSVEGRGTTFSIVLPAVEAEPARPAPQEPDGPAGGTETILLVEDDDAVRPLIRKVLVGGGWDVLEAADPHEALALGRECERPIHLLLTDVVMPSLNGRELAQRLNAFRSETRLLYMSGHTDDAMFDEGVVAEGAMFIQKPFTPGELTRKIREVLDRPLRSS